MSNEMVERVARVLCDWVGEEDWTDESRVRYRDGARKLIEAMRDATEAQLAAGRDAIQPSLYEGRVAQRVTNQYQIASETWRAMIDETLKVES